MWSGDATGGNGGDASADGGDAASGIAVVHDAGKESGPSCGCWGKREGGWTSDSGVVQKDNAATGGNGGSATGGDGGDANSGNLVAGNGNARSSGDEPSPIKPEPQSKNCGCGVGDWGRSGSKTEGGDTWVSSGDATGGNGGDASADGGDAAAGIAVVHENGGPSSGSPCGCGSKRGTSGDGVVQEYNSATGGNGGSATGGAGGSANSGNFVGGNGNALSSAGNDPKSASQSKSKCGCDGGGWDRSGGKTEGGDTWVWSGDATGGNGGDASADGGDAAAGIAFVHQFGWYRPYGGAPPT